MLISFLQKTKPNHKIFRTTVSISSNAFKNQASSLRYPSFLHFSKAALVFMPELLWSHLWRKLRIGKLCLKLGIPVTIFRRRIKRNFLFLSVYSPDTTAFKKRMGTLESKLMHNSEKWWDFKQNYSLLSNISWKANTRWQGSKQNRLNF